VSIEEATARCRDVIEAIRATLIAGQPVNLWKIGTLSVYRKQGYRYRSPGDGQLKIVPARRYVRFVLSSTLRDAINGG
jgi:nucleoid DNA-binding protein